MSGILQAVMRDFRSYNSLPMPIGTAYGGGFFAGQINVSGTKYNLVVAPKASGESTKQWWTVDGTTVTGATSVIDGPSNSATLASLGAAYPAAVFCEGLAIGGYSDWYLPSKNELEVLYYFLKPTAEENYLGFGSNANAMPPEPISTSYTALSPAQTSANGFRTGEVNAFATASLYGYYASSTERNGTSEWIQAFGQGLQDNFGKFNVVNVRAVRRVPV